jgi:hypothetical protein
MRATRPPSVEFGMRSMSVPGVIGGLLMAVAGMLTVAGCGSTDVPTIAVTYSRSTTVPAAETTVLLDKNGAEVPQLRWGSGDQLILTTWGSGSCPELPTSMTLQNAHRLTIGLYSRPGSGNNGCTADLTPTDSVITAPAGLDDGTPAVAQVEGNEVPLSPRK